MIYLYPRCSSSTSMWNFTMDDDCPTRHKTHISDAVTQKQTRTKWENEAVLVFRAKFPPLYNQKYLVPPTYSVSDCAAGDKSIHYPVPFLIVQPYNVCKPTTLPTTIHRRAHRLILDTPDVEASPPL